MPDNDSQETPVSYERQAPEVCISATVYHEDGGRSEYAATFPGEQIGEPEFVKAMVGVMDHVMPGMPDDGEDAPGMRRYTFGGDAK